MDNEENFIPSIFNYCDRWCERCEFTARCRTFAMEKELGVDDEGDPMGAAVQTVANALAEAKRLLTEKAEEMGIDLEAAMDDPEIDAGFERQREFVESQEAVDLSKRYTLETRHVLDRAEEWAGDVEEDPMIGEMLTIIQWYLFFLPVKVHGAYNDVLDLDGYEDQNEFDNPQSHANGTAKIALISIERSILAWTYLLNQANSTMIRPIIERLETTKVLVEGKFPHAREFIRPGFDEIEMVM